MPPIWNATDISRALVLRQHHVFLRWLVLAGVIAFVFFVAWHQGFLGELYGRDKSYISMLITLLFLGFSAHCAVRTYQLSAQLDAAARVSEILRNAPSRRLSLAGERVWVANGLALPHCLLSGLVAEFVRKRDAGQDVRTLWAEQSQLMDVYSQQIKGGYEIGWFVADAMIKLGLLGTVVGFIIMLGSITGIATFDASVVQEVLTAMSGGMGVALYTTLTGLVCGMLLALQYQLLDRGSDDLIALMVRVIDVQVSPYLKTATEAAAE